MLLAHTDPLQYFQELIRLDFLLLFFWAFLLDVISTKSLLISVNTIGFLGLYDCVQMDDSTGTFLERPRLFSISLTLSMSTKRQEILVRLEYL